MRCEIDVVVAKEVSETNLRVKDPSYIVTPKNFSFIVMGTQKIVPTRFKGEGRGFKGESTIAVVKVKQCE